MIPSAQFEHQLPLLFDDDRALADWLAKDALLVHRYQYDAKNQQFKCRSKRKFQFYAENNPEKDFYTLLNPHVPRQNLAQYVSESDLVKYYLIYCWATDFAHTHKLGTAWQASFQAAMHQQIYQKSKQRLDTVIANQSMQWSRPKKKLYNALVKQIAHIPALDQKIHYYQQLADQASQKHFYHDDTKHSVFSQYSDAVARYEYELLTQELQTAIEPILYYPKSVRQQANICEYGRHCFFRDKDTKELKYINTWGTIFTLPETTLLAKNVNQIQSNGKKSVLSYQHPRALNKVANFLVDRMESADFGAAFQLNAGIVRSLVPKGLPEDPIIKLAEKTLKDTKQYYQTLQHGISLFHPDYLLAAQHRMAGLIQIKEMLQDKPTREIRQTNQRPTMADFIGAGRNTYVWFEDPLYPEHTELWHIDRSETIPVLTQFPLQTQQAQQIRSMFAGARSLALLKADKDNEQWYHYGAHAQRKMITDENHARLLFTAHEAKQIPKLVLSDMSIYEHVMDDWTYYATSNQLIHLLETIEKTPENSRLIERCYTIHRQLNLIEQDRLRAFPASRGIVPPAKRQEIMQMMIALLQDKTSPQARHYFRTQHRVYHAVLQDDGLDAYEPASFIWDDHETLWYLDEHKCKQSVIMTDSIRRKLQAIAAQSTEGAAQYISGTDVYNLMTKPRLFYYYRSIPIGLDLRWLDFSYYVPLNFDRSQGLHTGTAHELLLSIHEYKLSISGLLYKFGEILIMEVIPLILAACGIDFPYQVLGKIGEAIVTWVILLWNIQFTYEYLKYTLLMNDLVHPELNQLDKMLQDLNHDVQAMITLEQDMVEEDTLVEADLNTLPSPSAYLSYLSLK